MTSTHLPDPTPVDTVTLTLPLVEQFGPTLQGEGPAAGRVAAFIRLGGCNLSCTWCDTPYSWDGTRHDLRTEITPTPVATVLDTLPPRAAAPTIVITGGEPLLHQHDPAWTELLQGLHETGREVHVETNGTRAPNSTSRAGIDTFLVSPKLPNAGTHRGQQDPALHQEWPQWAHALDAHLKFVCEHADDVHTAALLAARWGWPRHRTWVMPQGTSREELDHRWPNVASAATHHGINATHRLHVLAWGDERGH